MSRWWKIHRYPDGWFSDVPNTMVAFECQGVREDMDELHLWLRTNCGDQWCVLHQMQPENNHGRIQLWYIDIVFKTISMASLFKLTYGGK